MAAYLIVQATVTDWSRFKDYTDVVPQLIEEFGGEYVVMDGSPEWIEGDSCPGSVVVSKWSSKEAAKAFWHSSAYQQVISLRAGTGDFNIMLVDGLK